MVSVVVTDGNAAQARKTYLSLQAGHDFGPRVHKHSGGSGGQQIPRACSPWASIWALIANYGELKHFGRSARLRPC